MRGGTTGALRILHVLKHAERDNGSVHMAVDLACAQAEAGHAVSLAAARVFHADLLRRHGVEVLEVTEPTMTAAAARTVADLWSVARRTRPQVVHSHMMSATVLARPLATTLRVPLVTTMHNSFDRHSELCRLADVVVAVSEAERRSLLARGFAPRRVTAVLNGTGGSPREGARDDDSGAAPGPRTVLALSGLHRRKAVHDVVSAFALVADEIPDWGLSVVGWGPDSDDLLRQVSALGLQDRIRLPGPTLAPHRALAAADIFVTATLADPCPLAVMEARFAGCAIVATDVGGIPEILEFGRAGQLVPPHDPAAMAARLLPLMKDPEELAVWQRRAREGAELFSVARMAEDYVAVYRRLLGRRHQDAG